MSRRIPEEIKEEMLNQVQDGERVTDLAEQYAVSTKTIYGWLRQDSGEAVVSVPKYNMLKRENEELKRCIGELLLSMHLQKSRPGAPCQDQVGVCRRAGHPSHTGSTRDGAVQSPPTTAPDQTVQHRFYTPSQLPQPAVRSDGHRSASGVASGLSRLVYWGTVWDLATIEDLATRPILAKRIGTRHASQQVLGTLYQAFTPGVRPFIFQADQGTEFMVSRWTDYLDAWGIHISVRDVASPWQNGYVASFFGPSSMSRPWVK